MINFIKNFRKDEDGAVTVDWVVLTAAIVGLGVAAVSTVEGGVDTWLRPSAQAFPTKPCAKSRLKPAMEPPEAANRRFAASRAPRVCTDARAVKSRKRAILRPRVRS